MNTVYISVTIKFIEKAFGETTGAVNKDTRDWEKSKIASRPS